MSGAWRWCRRLRPKLIKLGAKLHMQSGAGAAASWPTPPSRTSCSSDDRQRPGRDADVVLAVQPPALEVIDAMKPGAILISFIYADKEPALVQASAGQEDHLLRHGAYSAHHPRAGDGCAVQPIGAGRLLRGATRRDASGPCAAEDHLGGGRDRAGQGAGHGPRRRGSRSDRDRASSGRRRRRLRCAPGNRGAGASLGATFVETGVDARGKGGYARELTRGGEEPRSTAVLTKHIQRRTDHHDRRHSRAAVAEADQQGAGRRHESRCGDRRSVGRGRRQLRGHAARARPSGSAR